MKKIIIALLVVLCATTVTAEEKTIGNASDGTTRLTTVCLAGYLYVVATSKNESIGPVAVSVVQVMGGISRSGAVKCQQ